MHYLIKKHFPDPEVFAQELKAYDIISFDLFDTLILRKFADPADVFYLVQEECKYLNLKRIRQHAEFLAREERKNISQDAEVNLKEIWEKAEEISGADDLKGMEAEWRAEQASCLGNPYFLELVPRLKAMGKILIICSDMYLGEKYLKELLKQCGYPPFDEFFVSCDKRASKSTGALYDIVRKHYGERETVCHIGDNRHSDFLKAREKNISAYLYPNVHERTKAVCTLDMSPIIGSVYAGIINTGLCNGLFKRTQEYELGFVYGGLLVTGYCQFIHRYVRSDKTDRILFFSRDGDILLKAYRLLFPVEDEKLRYALWSRLAAAKMCAKYFKSHYLERMVLHKIDQGYSFNSLFATMEISDLLVSFLKENGEKFAGHTLLDGMNYKTLLAFIEHHWEEICIHYESELEAGRRYYEELLKGSRRAVCVDAGWVGSGAMLLKYLVEEVWNLDCRMSGLLAACCDGNGNDHEISEIQLINGDLKTYLFSPAHNRDLWMEHHAAKGHNLILELLLSSPQPSFRGFCDRKEGGFCFCSGTETINAREIQAGILDFVRQYAAHPLCTVEIPGRDAAAPLQALCRNRKKTEKLLHTSRIRGNVE